MTVSANIANYRDETAVSRYDDFLDIATDLTNGNQLSTDHHHQTMETRVRVGIEATPSITNESITSDKFTDCASLHQSDRSKLRGKKRPRRYHNQSTRQNSRSHSSSGSISKRRNLERSFSRSRSSFRSHSSCSFDPYIHRKDRGFERLRRSRNPKYSPLPLEWWERSEECKEAKIAHVEKIDWLCCSREFLVLQTTLLDKDTALERNMFPYSTPPGIEHYTLWSKNDLNHYEIIDYVDNWLSKNFPKVRRWQYDDNMGERSILLFHVHVFIEKEPYYFTPRPGQEYFPPHMHMPISSSFIDRH